MSQAPTQASGLVRVTVTSATRRVDLVLPGGVPVAELVPELARSVGLLDAVTVHGGYRLVTRDGRALATDSGLTAQGVEDGGIIAVAARVDDEPTLVYDDVVEAMADVVERDLETWSAAAGRRTALAAAALLLLAGAGSLLTQRGSDVAAVASAAVAVLLVLGAVVLSHTRRETQAAVAVALVGCVQAAVAGVVLTGDELFSATQVAAAGGGALAAGLVAALGVAEGRALLLPPVFVGAVFAAAGLVGRGGALDPAAVLTTALAVVALAGGAFPCLALAATGTTVDRLLSVADVDSDPEPIDAERVAADARIAHEILMAVAATAGVLLVLIAPVAVSLGVAGCAVSVLSCLVVMLRTRRYRSGVQVLVGLASGVLGLVATAVSALWLHAGWRPAAAVVLTTTGAVLLVLTLPPRSASVRRGVLADVLETVALLTVVPALVVATGLYSAIPG